MLERKFLNESMVVYQSPLLAQVGVAHAFTTRLGGVSAAPFDSLNLGVAEADRPGAVAENGRRLRASLGCAGHELITVSQVHGCQMHVPPDPRTEVPAAATRSAVEADAILSDRPDALLMIRVADCVPVLLADVSGQYIAAIHAGWRGLVAGVIPQTVEALRRRFGLAGGDLRAAIGPCISAAHFEVGPEVAQAFVQAGLEHVVVAVDGHPRPHIDLSQAAFAQLRGAGVQARDIDASDRCTFRDQEEFYSHRRDAGRTGRQAAVIARRGRPR